MSDVHSPPPGAREWLRAVLLAFIERERAVAHPSGMAATSSLVGHLQWAAQLAKAEGDELLALLNGKTSEEWAAMIAKGELARRARDDDEPGTRD